MENPLLRSEVMSPSVSKPRNASRSGVRLMPSCSERSTSLTLEPGESIPEMIISLSLDTTVSGVLSSTRILGIRTVTPVSVFEDLSGYHIFHILHAIDAQHTIEVVDLVLQELG